MTDARGGIVLGWIFKLMLLLTLIAIVSFETGAVVVAKVTADRVAISAADEAGQVLQATGSTTKAHDAADKVAAREGTTVVGFKVVNSGREVEVTVRKLATTFLIQHIPGVRKFRIADSTHLGEVR